MLILPSTSSPLVQPLNANITAATNAGTELLWSLPFATTLHTISGAASVPTCPCRSAPLWSSSSQMSPQPRRLLLRHPASRASSRSSLALCSPSRGSGPTQGVGKRDAQSQGRAAYLKSCKLFLAMNHGLAAATPPQKNQRSPAV